MYPFVNADYFAQLPFVLSQFLFVPSALVHGGVLFVGADHNSFERAVVAGASVICALGYGAGNGMVGLFDLFHLRVPSFEKFHPPRFFLRYRGDGYSIAPFSAFIPDLLTFSLRNDIIFSENAIFSIEEADMPEFHAPALKYRNDILLYRREIITLGGDFDGTAGLGNFSSVTDWLEFLFTLDPCRAADCGYYPTEVYLAYDSGNLFGIFNVRLNDSEEIRSRAGHIGYNVRPTMQRRGYGKTLLNEAVRILNENGISSPVVCTFPGNTASQKTALSCGFVREEDGTLDSGESVARFVYRR